MIASFRTMRVLAALIRWPAVLAWSGGGIFLAMGLAGPSYLTSVARLNLLLLTGTVLLLHGVASHALNDCTDWYSGTDRISPGLLSGGSRVIPRGLAAPQELMNTGVAGVVLAVLFSLWLLARCGSGVLLPLAVGLWAPLSYSLPPFALAYRPFAGEWLSAFPALMACSLGTYWVLTDTLGGRIWIAAFIYSLTCQAWFAEHHLADVVADLCAQPRKLTTEAWVTLRWGRDAARLVPAVYALAAAMLALGAGFLWNPRLYFAALPALSSTALALRSPAANVLATTRAELAMMALSLVQAGLLVFLLGP